MGNERKTDNPIVKTALQADPYPLFPLSKEASKSHLSRGYYLPTRFFLCEQNVYK